MGEIAINPIHNVHKKYRKMNLVNSYVFGNSFDIDTQAFITAAGLTDNTQKSAINTLVVALKANSLWTKMKAIYPFIGGTNFTHKWNLKDPRDLDAAFRLVFNNITHSSSGATGNGTNGYAYTSLNANTRLTASNNHLSNYCITDTNGNYIDMGSGDLRLFQRLSNVAYSDNPYPSSRITVANTTSLGFYINTRTSTTSHKLYKNNSIIASSTETMTSALASQEIWLFNSSNTGNYYSNRTYAWFSIGDGLTDTDTSNLYTAVQAYQTALGRQV